MRSEADLKGAVHHVVYEYANLLSAGRLLKTKLKPPRNTHIQDAFLLSCRKLGAFFSNKATKPDDVRSRDYFSTGATPKFRLPEWRTWGNAMDQQLAHITYARIRNARSWDGSRNDVLLREFCRAWTEFRARLAEPYRSEFEKAIKKRKEGPGFRRLGLH